MEAGIPSGAVHRQAVEDALTCLESALDQVTDVLETPGRLAGTDSEVVVEWAQRVEHVTNRLPVGQQLLVRELDIQGCRQHGSGDTRGARDAQGSGEDGPAPATAGDSPGGGQRRRSPGLYGSLEALLEGVLQISRVEAKARVRAARTLTPTVEISGHVRPPEHAELSEAQHTGRISAERVGQGTKALADWQKLIGVTPGVTADKVHTGQALLAHQAGSFPPRDVAKLITAVGDHINPDGLYDDTAAQEAARTLSLTTIRGGLHAGMTKISGYLTAQTAVLARAVLDPLTTPQPVLDETGATITQDQRDHPMRRHDALHAVLDRSRSAGDTPAHGGTPAAVIITCDQQTLISQTGHGTCQDGTVLPIHHVAEIADETDLITATQDQTGSIVRLGRSRRIATATQTYALIARDGGCTFPGCDRPPKWCQRHHITEWAAGGPTDLDNLTLLCSYHHHRYAQHGWDCHLDHGTVTWTPPAHLDPERTPMTNTRHRKPVPV